MNFEDDAQIPGCLLVNHGSNSLQGVILAEIRQLLLQVICVPEERLVKVFTAAVLSISICDRDNKDILLVRSRQPD
jgi:hypothetical protein